MRTSPLRPLPLAPRKPSHAAAEAAVAVKICAYLRRRRRRWRRFDDGHESKRREKKYTNTPPRKTRYAHVYVYVYTRRIIRILINKNLLIRKNYYTCTKNLHTEFWDDKRRRTTSRRRPPNRRLSRREKLTCFRFFW